MTRAHRRGPWLPEEDQALMQLVQSQGPNNWVRISTHMHYRSPKQCRERFHQNLKPSLNHEPINAEEGEMIEQMVAEMGKRWAEIARRLGNRSDNAVKNWWNGSMNRRRRNVIQSSSKTLSNRLEPLSATRHAITPIASQSHRRHSYSRSWNDSQSGLSRSSHEHAQFQAPHTQHALYHNQYAHQEASHVGDYRMTMDGRGEQQLPSLGLPKPIPAAYSSAPSLYSSAPRPQMLLLPSPQRQLEPPMISPVGSEISLSASLERAPSLISDHNSNSSISPKTMHSPRPDLPAPIDTRSTRRGSLPSVETPSHTYHSDEGYVSAYPQSAGLEGKHFGSHLHFPRPEEHRSSHLSPWQRGHHHSHSASNSSLPSLVEHPMAEKEPRSARDTRMTFSSLLN